MEKAFFFDRDGVVIEEENYLADPRKVRLCSGVPQAIRLAREAGYRVVVVSNQSGIARGYLTPDDLKKVSARMDELLRDQGVFIDRTYYCFHHPHGSVKEYAVDCPCRKPKPGMLLQASQELQLDLAASFMIGDRISDLEAGIRAGCRAVALVRTGYGQEQDLTGFPDVCDARDVLDAVRQLLSL